MIVLNTANLSFQYLLGGAVTTNQLPFVINYVTTTREGQTHFNSANGTSNNATAVTILAAPTAGEKRSIQAFSVYNADTANATVTVRLNDNGTLRNIVVVTLSASDHLIYTSSAGWFVLTSTGFLKSTSTAVNLDDLGDVVITSPVTNAVLVYNGTNWVNQAQANVVNGGTGRATATAYAVLCGGTVATGAHQSIAGVGTSGQALISNGASALPTFQNIITLGTEVASTSGTSIDFTGIPSGAKFIGVHLIEVSLSGTTDILIQLGKSTGVETTGYICESGVLISSAVGQDTSTVGFIIRASAAARTVSGTLWLALEDSSDNTWTAGGSLTNTAPSTIIVAGRKALAGTLDRVRVTTVNGTDTFDAGVINISYQG